MANMEEHRRPLTDLEDGNSPDLVAEAVRFALREQDKLEESLTVLESASGIASTKDESLGKIMIEPTFSQGGGT
jgi:hypothetical protein